MKDGLKAGLIGEIEVTVGEGMVINFLGEGFIPVYSTPSLIDHLEAASRKALEDYLDEGEESVGTVVNVKHLAPTPIGMKVTAKAILVEVDRRRCSFEVEAFDEKEKIGEGSHERFVINIERFSLGVEDKKGSGK